MEERRLISDRTEWELGPKSSDFGQGLSTNIV